MTRSILRVDHLPPKKRPLRDFHHGLLAALVGVSDKTFQRARGTSQRLDPVTSDRLFRAASLVALAGEVLESNEGGIAWLSRAQIGLGGRVPFDLMTTEAGAEQVEQLLLRIEHGVYS